MPLLDLANEQSWLHFIEEIDSFISLTTEVYYSCMALAYNELAHAYSELAKLRYSQEPDYSAKGLSVAYAMTCLPRRSFVFAATYSSLLASIQPRPRRILDIGSGNGAVCISVDWLMTNDSAQIVCVEPSNDMRLFSSLLPCNSKLVVEQFSGTFQDYCTSEHHSERLFDLIVMSAALPQYVRFESPDGYWEDISERLRRFAAPTAAIVVIEPKVKSNAVGKLAAALSKQGFTRRVTAQCRSLPKVQLDNATSIVRGYQRTLLASEHLSESLINNHTSRRDVEDGWRLVQELLRSGGFADEARGHATQALPQRSDGRRMGGHRAAQPTCQTRWATAWGGHARGAQRDLLCRAGRDLVAGDAA